MRMWRNWQTRKIQVLVGDHAGSSPVIRTIYAEYRIKTRYSAFFVPFLHKECISTIAYGAFLGLIWD